LAYHPLVWFLIFLFSFSLLVYGHLSLTIQIWILFMGVVLPFFLGLAALSQPIKKEKPAWEEPFPTSLSAPSSWIVIIFVFVMLVSRFLLLGQSAWWPAGDEALNAFYLPFWAEHWQGALFIASSQIPSTLSQLAFFIFKLTQAPLLSVQLVPALISCATVGLAYQIARLYFSKTNALIVFLLFAFSYWPLFISWTFLPGITTPLWELILFYLLYQIKKSSNKNAGWFFIYGLALGACPYTFFSWPVLFLWSAAAVFLTGKHSAKKWIWLGAGLFITLAPYLWAISRGPYGDYFWGIAGKGQVITGLTRAKVMAEYISSLFWGAGSGTWFPQTGGYLNVILSACGLVGFIELFRFKRLALVWACLSALFLFMLPGLLSRDFEGHRILLALPILLWIVAVGIQSLLVKFPKSRQLAVLVLLLGLSLVLDLKRVNNPVVNELRSEPVSNERRFSYEALKPIADHNGPGLIFSECIPNTTDYSLSCFSYPFNAAFNPKLAPEKAQWVSIFTADYYQNDLSKRFPQLRWVSLPEDKHHVLALMPLTEQNRKVFLDWVPFYRFEMNLNYQFADNPSGKSRDFLLKEMMDIYPSLSKDPFIQSCFFQKLFYLYSAEKTFNLEDTWCSYTNFSDLFHAAYRNSYQNSTLSAQLLGLLILEHQDAEARKLLEKIKRNPA
jgi:hypothetical protein